MLKIIALQIPTNIINLTAKNGTCKLKYLDLFIKISIVELWPHNCNIFATILKDNKFTSKSLLKEKKLELHLEHRNRRQKLLVYPRA